MKKLRLIREMTAWPLFCPDIDEMGHIDVNDLQISKDLKTEILEWDKAYQDTYIDDNPAESGFKNKELNDAHIEQGKELARKLQAELGSEIEVEFLPL